MKFSATVPEEVLSSLPDDMCTDENIRIFRAAYKQVTSDACVDMRDIHPLDDTYYNMALYATLRQLYTKTGNQDYYERAMELETEVTAMAELEGVNLERIANSRVYFVAAQVKPYAVSAGMMPESQPIPLPYCETYTQAQQVLRLTSSDTEIGPSSRYGANGDKMPRIEPVHGVYTVWAEPERIEMLQRTPGIDIISMPSMAPINPKTVTEVDFQILDNYLNRGRHIHEDVAVGEKPTHETLRHDMDICASGMLDLQAALSKTPITQRDTIELHTKDREAFVACFARHGFVHKSPFELTFQERVLQLTMSELSTTCNAATLRHITALKENFLKQFSEETPSMHDITCGLRQHLEVFQQAASNSDKEAVSAIRDAVPSIVNIISNERADIIIAMDECLTAAQRDYLKVTRTLVPEQLRNEFVIRAADKIRGGLNTEASVRMTCRTMAKEAHAAGYDMIEDQMNAAGANANMHYAEYRDAVEQEEVPL